MGIHCEINLCKPVDGVYTPGSTVSGAIKYCVDEDTVFGNITVSLKGNGWIALEDNFKSRNNEMSHYQNREDYVDIDHVIQSNEKVEPLPIGSYETQFTFKLPFKIPPSFKYFKNRADYTIRCKIMYYIRIKFERPGLFNLNKTFKKNITVISGITPRLPTEPTVYGEQKSLLQLSSLFSSKKSIVSIKATILNSIIKPGDFIKVDYEIENATNVTIKAVEIKLVQVDNYTTVAHYDVKVIDEIKGLDIKYGTIKGGETKTFTDELASSLDLASIDHSKFIARDYAVCITAVLPLPHRNLVLEIPIQVSERFDDSFEAACSNNSDAPPSYWEVMGELENEKSGKPTCVAEDSSDDESKEKS